MVAIDPGINGCGMACFEDGLLVWAKYVKSFAHTTAKMEERVYGMANAVVVADPARLRGGWIFERPRVYLGKKVNPDDLIPLAEIGACLMGIVGMPLKIYRPHDWKFSVDGDVMVERIKDRLSTLEHRRIILPSKSLAHNVYDAAGLGLAHLGRLERKRVIAR